MSVVELEEDEVASLTDPVPLVGVEELDRQHRVLAHRWRILEDARLRGDRRAVRANLWFLERYAAEHFAAEERMMEEVRFPGLHRHRHQHERFSERVHRLRLAVDVGREQSVTAHFRWIASWFVDHVREQDVALGRFVQARTSMQRG
jgi:hemerythrin-like metal-binding protein